jgi:hypothetical protein
MGKFRRNSLAGFLAGLGFVAFFCALLLMLRFYATSPSAPDNASGHTFPIPAHGTLYVSPDQGYLFYGLISAFVVFMVASILLRRR